ncbi:hypothetical protein N7536_007717 [Penicillium majusculum]|uniref:Uncharacterized protein n=1 Tax=Penicillium solitum TaxID=60172 RepID=A0A1V6Q3R4_9EURO|nr:uncharacterized protein PENSOL_c137G07845 [Penicillium solitum]KAJ5685098.1 hypothetical protein N7536_007717 [Penicillium majusculum]OQD83908.1 hypothetical protein PENSOL_c137G07845 [Penicillium solitum]
MTDVMPRLLPGVGLVIGSASGIGRSVSFAFARVGVAGLFLADINMKALEETANDIRRELPDLKVVTHQVDVGNEESCIDCVRTAAKTFGRIDYVLNNVGIGGNQIPTVEQDSAELNKVLNLNFVGLWICQREQVKQMLTQEKLQIPSGRGDRGVITNTASILGLVGGPVGASPYAASKHAILGMTKTEAVAYSKDGIRINSICPGYVSTAILGNNDPKSRAEIESKMTSLIPMGRLGEADEIADSIVFLSSHMASYITGTALVVDGGYTSV